MKKILFILLAVLVMFGIAACQEADEPADTTPAEPETTEPAEAAPAEPEPVVGSAAVAITFTPQVGTYETTATGTIDLKAPLTGAKVEVYTKTEGEKKVAVSVDLGDIAEDQTINTELTLSMHSVSYTIGEKAGIEQKDFELLAAKNHNLGIDITAGDVTANWESDAFSFDDDDAFATASE